MKTYLKPYPFPITATYFNHTIEAYRLAARYDGLFYAFIDGMLDAEIKPSRYPAVTIRRIKAAYAHQFIFEKKG